MLELPLIPVTPNPDIRTLEIDDEGRRYVVVDNFLTDPQSLVSYAAGNAGMFYRERVGHAGRSPDLGAAAIEELQRFVRSTLSGFFPFHRTGVTLKVFFSNVSLKPEELSSYHRICHVDPRLSPGHRTYAGVIYLFANPELGGTAFYRWKARDVAVRAYQIAMLESDEVALQFLEQHSAVFRKPAEYMTSSNDIAELLCVAPPCFNRLVFYDGESPHSLHITRPELLNQDPTRGRLTLNLIANVTAKDLS
ncbi:MAG: DUF6445 family protein [Gammaproteobacteria bacterium]|nr:DUF6445 family protein [Gammaproteobacteria bacterium]MDH5305020.1 DUF6445 family protein [Gammaproteobacteria bacterium]MDH5322913.1 DUF6445 family protein [Gammaproteobacteria bacterium]